MPSHTFTFVQPIITVPLTPPPGAAAVIIRATVTKGPEPGAAVGLRLLHLRNKVQPGSAGRGNNDPRPKATQLLEIVYRNGIGVVAWHGFGPKQGGHRDPSKTGKLPESFPVVLTVPLENPAPAGSGVVSVADFTFGGRPELVPGHEMELLLGFEGEGDLRPPLGWTVSWPDNAVEWVGATAPPPAPPAHGGDAKAEFIADVEKLAIKYATSQLDPKLLLLLQLLLQAVK